MLLEFIIDEDLITKHGLIEGHRQLTALFLKESVQIKVFGKHFPRQEIDGQEGIR